MKQAFYGRISAALLLSGLLLGSCGGNSNTSTSTPTSTLGTDSAATKVGSIPAEADTAATTTTMGVPAGRTTTTPANTMGTGQ